MARRYLRHVGWRARLVAVPVALVGACALLLLGNFVAGWPSDWSGGLPFLSVVWLALYLAGLTILNGNRAATLEEEHGWRRWQ